MSTSLKKTPARRTTYRSEWVDRWSPPKPLVGLQAIEKVLNRHTFLVCPESRRVVAVLARAIHDSLSLSNRRMRREARRFLLGDDLTLWCDLVGLHPDFVRFVARKAGYLADLPRPQPAATGRTDPCLIAIRCRRWLPPMEVISRHNATPSVPICWRGWNRC